MAGAHHMGLLWKPGLTFRVIKHTDEIPRLAFVRAVVNLNMEHSMHNIYVWKYCCVCLWYWECKHLMNSGFYVFIHFTAFCALGDAKSLKWKACFKCLLMWEKFFVVTLHNDLEKFSVIKENCEQKGHNDLEALFPHK